MVIAVRVKADTKKVDFYLKSIEGKLKSHIKARAARGRDEFVSLAKAIAPSQSGKLRDGIMKGSLYQNKKETVATVEWKELDTRRGNSFKKAQSKRFLTWIENSPEAAEFFRTGPNRFITKAQELMNVRYINGMKAVIAKTIKR